MLIKFGVSLLLSIIILNSCQTDVNRKRLIFSGDLLLDRGVRERIDHYGVGHLFTKQIDSVFATGDFVFANLECPATEIVAPINKKYIFRAEPDYLKFLKSHGITHLNLANNHSMDQGRKGLVDTRDNILSDEMIPTGFGMNHKEACTELLIAKEPRPIYLLSSLQVPSENWTFLMDQPCVCEASIQEIEKRIRSIRKTEPFAVIIVQLHWGAEHTSQPMIVQIQQAHQLVDAGADCIIGHHSHTIQTVENYKGKPIYYSIGNFIFDQNKPINSEGLMVILNVDKNHISVEELTFDIRNCVPHLRK